MKLTVVGFWGAYPEMNEPTSGYLLETKNSKLLIECGSGVLCNLPKYIDFNELDGVIVSHEHADHCADLVCLIYNAMIEKKLGKRNKHLSIYVPQSMSHIKDLCNEDFAAFNVFDEGSSFKISDIVMAFSKNIHPVESYAISFSILEGNKSSKITFTGDTQWNDELVKLSGKSDLLISECSLFKRAKNIIPGHMTSEEAGKLATLSESKKLLLTHLPHFGNHNYLLTETMESFDKEIILAKCGLSLEI